MGTKRKIVAMIGCIVLIIISWFVVLKFGSYSQKQIELMENAKIYIADKAYIRAIPLLEESASYKAKYTVQSEELLKETYLKLGEQREYQEKYIDLLEKQMQRDDATLEVFEEAANYYLKRTKITEALKVLRNGVRKLGDDRLLEMYEDNRYVYDIVSEIYDDVTDFANETIGVKSEDGWGLASSDGSLIIPCEYDKVSTYDMERIVVQKSGEVYAVNLDNNRLVLLKEKISDFGNYANDRLPIHTAEGWKRANGEFLIGELAFEEMGMYSEGYVAAKKDGRWGVLDLSEKWLLPPEYDGIITDFLGRAYRQEAVFAKKGSSVYLFVKGKEIAGPYEDARVFGSEGYAAVKKNGKWGFIDINGEVKIKYQFDDALSFEKDLAAVKVGKKWGYLSKYGKMAIKPIFFEVRNFYNGSAPVLADDGWQFIQLLEYKRGGIF